MPVSWYQKASAFKSPRHVVSAFLLRSREALNSVLGRVGKAQRAHADNNENGGQMRPAHPTKPWEEWEIPREADTQWPEAAKKFHADWWEARIARQKEIDKSIAAKAEFEYLYDKPYDDKKKVRVAGPFTVESLSLAWSKRCIFRVF